MTKGVQINSRQYGIFLYAVVCIFVSLISLNPAAAECRRNGIGDASCTGQGQRPVARPANLFNPNSLAKTPNLTAPKVTSSLFNKDSLAASLSATQKYQNTNFTTVPTIDTKSVPGKKIAEAAYKTIGFSTVASDTDGGNLGCAVAVSKILENAGYPIGRITGTGTLFDKLKADKCYDMIHPMPGDASGLMPGDVLVTKARSGKAGHTGVYAGNGNIISNASMGYEGSKPGTVEQNYTYGKWRNGTATTKSVVSRNPGGSAVFRRKESCA